MFPSFVQFVGNHGGSFSGHEYATGRAPAVNPLHAPSYAEKRTQERSSQQ